VAADVQHTRCSHVPQRQHARSLGPSSLPLTPAAPPARQPPPPPAGVLSSLPAPPAPAPRPNKTRCPGGSDSMLGNTGKKGQAVCTPADGGPSVPPAAPGARGSSTCPNPYPPARCSLPQHTAPTLAPGPRCLRLPIVPTAKPLPFALPRCQPRTSNCSVPVMIAGALRSRAAVAACIPVQALQRAVVAGLGAAGSPSSTSTPAWWPPGG
jgi:hypothetical protein